MRRACFLGVAAFALMLFVGCGKEEDETLKVCINDTNRWYMDTLVEGWQEIEGGSEVEIVEIPTDGESAELKLSELRTEVMAGEGPDIFVLLCTPTTANVSHADLFSDLEKAMKADMFLPLDEYISNAKYIDTSGWNQTVLEAGKTEEGQVVLPLYYDLPAYVFNSSDMPEQEIPDTWEEFITTENPVLENAMKGKTFIYFTYSFSKLADYQTAELTFSEEDLKNYLEEYLLFEDKINAQNEEGLSEPIASGWVNGDFFPNTMGASEEEQICVSIPNREGGVTAMVSMFAAVNKNTQKAEEAFSFLDFMLSDEVTSKRGFTKEEKSYATSVDLNMNMGGITVNQKVFEERYCRNDKVSAAFETLNDRIDSVRFYSELDRDLYDLRTQYRMSSEPDIDQLVKTTYETMKMRLAE